MLKQLFNPEELSRLEVFAQRKREGLRIENCVQCGEVFSGANVFTREGARETQISGLCERSSSRTGNVGKTLRAALDAARGKEGKA